MASRIWRMRPDGTGLEWFAGGGFDNPVELRWIQKWLRLRQPRLESL